jgi:hypothetical protein
MTRSRRPRTRSATQVSGEDNAIVVSVGERDFDSDIRGSNAACCVSQGETRLTPPTGLAASLEAPEVRARLRVIGLGLDR